MSETHTENTRERQRESDDGGRGDEEEDESRCTASCTTGPPENCDEVAEFAAGCASSCSKDYLEKLIEDAGISGCDADDVYVSAAAARPYAAALLLGGAVARLLVF